MKNKIYLFIFLCFLPFHCKNQNIATYPYEGLLYRYIDNYCKDKILSENYLLFTHRTVGVCQTCFRISMDSIMSKVYKEKENYDLYVLFDNEIDMGKIQMKYKNNVHYLIGNHLIMDKYGISRDIPMLFVFRDSKLSSWQKFNRK